MRSFHHTLWIVAALLSTFSSIDKTGADAFRKRERKCRDAYAFGPVANGRPCQRAGVTCNSSEPACAGTFNDDLRSCTFTYQACTCRASSATNKTLWSCPTPKCGSPDRRCACPSPKLVKTSQECYTVGLNCPDGGVSYCFNMWDQDAKRCRNYTRQNTCFCLHGVWLCPVFDCRESPECRGDPL
jgi:hypothetical protein